MTIIEADTEVLEMDFDENEWLQDIREQTKRLADLYRFFSYAFPYGRRAEWKFESRVSFI